MVQLGDIPTEVLLKIAEKLANDPCHARYSQHNLCKLALTSRKLRPVAQEALHRSIVVRTLDPSDVRDDRGQSCFPARTALLCRTLLERKDLAEKVRCLQLVLWGEGSKNLNLRHTDGKTQCGIQCSPRWIELMSLCRAHILSESVPWATRTVRNAWLERLHPGCRTDETVLAGVILSCTSSLRHLRLVPLRNTDWWNPGSDGFELLEDGNMDPYGGCCSWVLVVKELFGGSYLGENFALATVPGFSSLESLDCTEVLPWEILRLPKLQRLRFALDTDIEYEKYVDTTCIYPSPPSREMFPASLKTLILDIEVAIFNDSLRSMGDQRYSWFYDICLPRLPALKHLELRSRCSWFEDYLFVHSLDFHNATISLCHEGLETLVFNFAMPARRKNLWTLRLPSTSRAISRNSDASLALRSCTLTIIATLHIASCRLRSRALSS
ncbi:hypothetical protein FB567DRAFT_274737 [Paraphoma chrysanthemicola]|uniref:F-box domain-containing protein n=1 Tax=Paraphoma chrysanthemicola TaxID=798071 RepID=A0A8K0REB7_9PLEO|nr:hypothetical protein FB567DRAFT_274737 [Paraphoma chrysanthemicola]